MGLLSETADDLNFAFEQLCAAKGRDPEHRRALKATLDNLFRVREYRLGPKVGKDEYANQSLYRQAVNQDPGGEAAEGLVLLRNAMTHHLAKMVEPELATLVPGLHVVPSPHTYPGANFTWISADELGLAYDVAGKKLARYDEHVAGRPALPTLQLAIDFLLTDPRIALLTSE